MVLESSEARGLGKINSNLRGLPASTLRGADEEGRVTRVRCSLGMFLDKSRTVSAIVHLTGPFLDDDLIDHKFQRESG